MSHLWTQQTNSCTWQPLMTKKFWSRDSCLDNLLLPPSPFISLYKKLFDSNANIKMLFVEPKTYFLIYLDSLLLTHTWWCQRSVWICCGRVTWETRVKDLVSHWDIFVSVPWSKCLTKSLTGYFVFGLLLGDQWLAPLSILIYQSWNLE